MQPLDLETFYAHAFALYQAGKSSDAAEVFQVLCAREPLESRFWFGLGASCQESADYSKALHAWAMSALLDKADPYPHFHAAQCAFSMGNIDDALLAMQEAKMKVDNPAHPLTSAIEILEESWRNRCPTS